MVSVSGSHGYFFILEKKKAFYITSNNFNYVYDNLNI